MNRHFSHPIESPCKWRWCVSFCSTSLTFADIAIASSILWYCGWCHRYWLNWQQNNSTWIVFIYLCVDVSLKWTLHFLHNWMHTRRIYSFNYKEELYEHRTVSCFLFLLKFLWTLSMHCNFFSISWTFPEKYLNKIELEWFSLNFAEILQKKWLFLMILSLNRAFSC